MKPAKKIVSTALWLGRGTATVMRLAVILALAVGLAPTALAGTGVGARTVVANCLDLPPTR